MAETDNETEFSFDLKSKLPGLITDLTLIEQSLLFAELSSICYYNKPDVEPVVSGLNFTSVKYFENDGAQAYLFAGEHETVIACRGTEPNEWNDIRADANATSAVEAIGGVAVRVHSGFKQEVDDLWPQLEKELESNTNTLWFTGHSLGAAMATICAGRCFLATIESMPAGLFTYGSPRVGDKRYINYCDINHIRWVNNNDIVTRVPPAWLGFRHGGKEMYLDAKGRVRDLTGIGRMKDRLRGFLRGLRKLKIDHFSDHSIDAYIEYIHVALEKERTAPPKSSKPAGVPANK